MYEIFKYLGILLVLMLLYHKYLPIIDYNNEYMFYALGLLLFYILEQQLWEGFTTKHNKENEKKKSEEHDKEKHDKEKHEKENEKKKSEKHNNENEKKKSEKHDNENHNKKTDKDSSKSSNKFVDKNTNTNKKIIEKAKNDEIVLTDNEVRNHVLSIVENIKNKTSLAKIYNLCLSEQNDEKREELIFLYNTATANPATSKKIVLSAKPKKIFDLTDLLLSVPEFRDFLLDSKEGVYRDSVTGDYKFNQASFDDMTPAIVPQIDDNWENDGYTMLDPKYWRPRVYASRDPFQEGKCPVCPSLTDGHPVNLLEFDQARYIMPSDNISVDYIKELNRRKF